jgi:hypothetical protein
LFGLPKSYVFPARDLKRFFGGCATAGLNDRSLTTSDHWPPTTGYRFSCGTMGQMGQELNPLFSTTILSQLVPAWDKMGQKMQKDSRVFWLFPGSEF